MDLNLALGRVPSGATIVGDYHTHGDYSMRDPTTFVVTRGSAATDQLDSDNFSGRDIWDAGQQAVKYGDFTAYLGTPSGVFKMYDAISGVTSVLK